MKTAVALALCLCPAAAASDDEQAQALLLQRAVEEGRAGVEQGAQGRAPAATAGAGGARRLAGSDHAGVISKITYPDTDPTCSGPPLRWDVEAPNYNTDGACESLTHPSDGQTYSQRGSCASATSFSSNLYQGDSCSGSQVGTWEKTDDDCVPIYDASNSYSYSYSFSYGESDLDGYAKWGCPDIPAADVAATVTFYIGSGTCNDADDQLKNYQVWRGGCAPQGDGTTARIVSCDADAVHIQIYPNSDCSGSPYEEFTWLETDTCTQGSSSMKVTCGCAAGVGCSDGSTDAALTTGSDAAAARGPLLATAVLGAAAAAL